MLSHVTPQLRYTIKGTSASFVKQGLDIQEDQLKAGAHSAVSKSDFGVEPTSLAGQLYTPGKVETITSEAGRYVNWFKNVAEVTSARLSLFIRLLKLLLFTVHPFRRPQPPHRHSRTGRPHN